MLFLVQFDTCCALVQSKKLALRKTLKAIEVIQSLYKIFISVVPYTY